MKIKQTVLNGSFGRQQDGDNFIDGKKEFTTITIIQGGRGWIEQQVIALLNPEDIEIEILDEQSKWSQNNNAVDVKILSGMNQLVTDFKKRPYIPKSGRTPSPQVVINNTTVLSNIYGVFENTVVVKRSSIA